MLESTAWHGFFKSVTLSGVAEPADLWVRDVSPDLFSLLGAKPLLGRTLLPVDFQSGAPQAAVLAYDTWQKYFHADPGLIGQTIFLDKDNYVVVGVMPKDFYLLRTEIAAWLPDRTPVSDPLKKYVAIVARLRPGVSLDRARAELTQLSPDLLRRYPPSQRNLRLNMEALTAGDTKDYRTAFLLLLGATGFLVLLSCLNVASLLLARASARQNEFTIRGALGASRGRLVWQVLTESLVLASLGGALGTGLAYAGNRVLLRLLPAYLLIPRLEETRLDLSVLGFAILLTFLVAICFGLVPAFALSATKLTPAGRQGKATGANSWRLNALLVGEASIALILFAGSILMVRGFVRLADVNPGVRTTNILTATVPPGRASRLSRAQLIQRYGEILRVTQNVPGIEQAALTGNLPFGKINVQLRIYIPGLSPNPYQLDFHAVSADYFHILGIPLLRGRYFDAFRPDTDKGTVVINRAMADKFWPNQDPIGQRLSSGPPPATPNLTIAGIVDNVQHRSLGGKPVPEFYMPYQEYLGPAVGTTLVLRTFGDPKAVALSLRRAIHRFDPDQVIANEQALRTTVEQSIATPRFYTILLAIFALLALALTLIGVYGVASYGVSLRTREFGIRMALGARPRQLIGAILRQGLLLALVGVATGGMGAWALARLMAGIVYGIPVRDPVSLSVAGSILLAGALLAYYVPARRSSKIDPATVLRQE